MSEKLLRAILQTLMYIRTEAHYISSLLAIDLNTKYQDNPIVSDLLYTATCKVLEDLTGIKSSFDDLI